MTKKPTKPDNKLDIHYDSILGDVFNIIDAARRSAACSINSIMTAAYWLIGRRVVEFEQKGSERADYGEELLKKLSGDLTSAYGRGFAKSNLYQMRAFYLAYQGSFQTLSGKSDSLELSYRTGKSRHRLENRSHGLPSLISSYLLPPSVFLGPSMCVCFRSRTNMPASSTRLKHFEAAGRFGNSTGR